MAEKTTKKVEKKEEAVKVSDPSALNIMPIISEKSYADANSLNRYHFYVGKNMNKIEVKKAVEKVYGVKVTSVNMSVRPGKLVKVWAHNLRYRKSDMKKAIVNLKKGDKIDEFFNI